MSNQNSELSNPGSIYKKLLHQTCPVCVKFTENLCNLHFIQAITTDSAQFFSAVLQQGEEIFQIATQNLGWVNKAQMFQSFTLVFATH